MRRQTIISVVKADAYGHGAAACARALAEEGCGYFAVASIDEAEELRQAGISLPILVLGYIPPERIKEALEFNLTVTVYEAISPARFRRLQKAEPHRKSARQNQHRNEQARAGAENRRGEIEKIYRLHGIEIEGVYSHYATADEEDLSYSAAQFEKFKMLSGA